MCTRPRLWWCASGNLTSLPLHAAGVHYGDNMDNVSNYFVSSYIPTINVLIRAQRREDTSKKSKTPSNVLLLASADVSGLPPLPNADREIEILKTILPPSLQVEIPDTALLPPVSRSITHPLLNLLSSASILHIACHAHQDRSNLLDSGFELYNGRLTIKHLMLAQNPHAQFAYLSACQSAAVDDTQPDEAMNLAAAMLFVGFRSIVATMWYAHWFYEALLYVHSHSMSYSGPWMTSTALSWQSGSTSVFFAMVVWTLAKYRMLLTPLCASCEKRVCVLVDGQRMFTSVLEFVLGSVPI
jgi:hypothetical protein